MSASDRMFEPPAPDLARINARLAALPPPLPALIQRAGHALAVDDLQNAQSALASALAVAPTQPDVLRLYGVLLSKVGNLRAAAANFEAAVRAAPDDAMGYWQYAQVCEEAGDPDAAWRLREQAVQRLPDSPLALADLGSHLARHRQPRVALDYLDRATRLAPGYAPAHLKLGNALVACGRILEGTAALRNAIAAEPAFGVAWLSLADIKTAEFTDAEAGQMRALLDGDGVDEHEYTAIEFALAKAYEGSGRYHEAFDLLVDANARRKHELAPWDDEKFVQRMQRTEEVFAGPHATVQNHTLGGDVIFIVGMPRSGTTLVEQILAAHPGVQGTGELGALPQVLSEESARLQRFFPDWVSDLAAADWQRLGQRYLELAGRFRNGAPHFTDKMPDNWQALGALRAMLPGAKVIICRRNPLENCWSCFKQYFPRGYEFTCDMEQLAAFWKAFDRSASQWTHRAPTHVRDQGYEVLTENPEAQVRALLDFCGLPFDPACLVAHQSRREVHTLSAAQVRQPIHRHAGTAAAYGALLDPLRRALAMPAAAAENDRNG